MPPAPGAVAMAAMVVSCIFFLCLWCGIIGGAEAVSPGIQHFDRYRSLLEGKKVGIVANQTAVLETGDGYKHSVDFLRDHRVQLIRIFCPEHGFRGDADAGETVGDYRDRQTGLPVISLYGKKKKPSPADLQGLDVVVFDMQEQEFEHFRSIRFFAIREKNQELGLPIWKKM